MRLGEERDNILSTGFPSLNYKCNEEFVSEKIDLFLMEVQDGHDRDWNALEDIIVPFLDSRYFLLNCNCQ